MCLRVVCVFEKLFVAFVSVCGRKVMRVCRKCAQLLSFFGLLLNFCVFYSLVSSKHSCH